MLSFETKRQLNVLPVVFPQQAPDRPQATDKAIGEKGGSKSCDAGANSKRRAIRNNEECKSNRSAVVGRQILFYFHQRTCQS